MAVAFCLTGQMRRLESPLAVSAYLFAPRLSSLGSARLRSGRDRDPSKRLPIGHPIPHFVHLIPVAESLERSRGHNGQNAPAASRGTRNFSFSMFDVKNESWPTQTSRPKAT